MTNTRRLMYTVLLLTLSSVTSADVFGQTSITLEQAIQTTLSSNQDVRMAAARLAQSRGFHRMASGRFDWRLSSVVERSTFDPLFPVGYALQAVEKSRERYAIDLRRVLRNGLQMGASVTVIHAELSPLTTTPVDLTDARLSLTIPLFRGLGAGNTAADERAAYIDLQGAETMRTQRVAGHVAMTAMAFYDCMAAQETLMAFREAEQRARDIQIVTEPLFKVKMLYDVDMFQLNATMEERKKNLRFGEQTVFRKRLALATAMGLPTERLANPLAANGVWPAWTDTVVLNRLSAFALARKFAARRGDYLNALTAMESARIRLQQADNARNPRVDLNADIGYTGYETGPGAKKRWSSFSSNISGPSLSVGLRVELPFQNREAQGAAALRQAALDEAEGRSDQLLSLIHAEIALVVEDLRANAVAFHAALAGERYLEAAVAYETERLFVEEGMKGLQGGLGQLMILQDRLVELKTDRIRIMRNYAVALIQLQLATGALLDHDEPVQPFDIKRLTILPSAE